jgi:hypothetical protein
VRWYHEGMKKRIIGVMESLETNLVHTADSVVEAVKKVGMLL